ncbi:MAG: hypothetical protein ACRDZX_14785 [Acidimicrobiales bacterium]
MRRVGLASSEVNIWTDRTAAATTVRALAGGSGRSAPSGPSPGRTLSSALHVLQWVAVVALVAASIAVDRAGHAAASRALDGVALGVFVVAWALRRRVQREAAR